MQVTNQGSVRVDLVGGTLDIEPINLIIKNVVTLNVATGLKATVTLSKIAFDGIEIHSKDYNKTYKYEAKDLTEDRVVYSKEYAEMSFVLQILSFNINHLDHDLAISWDSVIWAPWEA